MIIEFDSSPPGNCGSYSFGLTSSPGGGSITVSTTRTNNDPNCDTGAAADISLFRSCQGLNLGAQDFIIGYGSITYQTSNCPWPEYHECAESNYYPCPV